MTPQEREIVVGRIVDSLSQAYHANKGPKVIDETIQAEKPDSMCLATVLSRAASSFGGTYWPHISAIIGAHLQRVITEEHIAAQEKMGLASEHLAAASNRLATIANRLAWGGLFLAIVLGVMTTWEFVEARWRSSVDSPRSESVSKGK